MQAFLGGLGDDRVRALRSKRLESSSWKTWETIAAALTAQGSVDMWSRRREGSEIVTFGQCCRVLGVGPDASPEELHRVYKRLALLHHPDRMPGNAGSHLMFCRVTEAYAILKGLGGTDGGEPSDVGICDRCESVGRLIAGLDGGRYCADCLLARRQRRLPMLTPKTVRCLLTIGLQIAATACLVLAIREDSVRIGGVGLVLALGSLVALSWDVMRSVVSLK